MTAVHAVATEAAPFVIAMIGRRAAAVLAGTVGGLLRVGGGSLRTCCLNTGGGQYGGPRRARQLKFHVRLRFFKATGCDEHVIRPGSAMLLRDLKKLVTITRGGFL